MFADRVVKRHGDLPHAPDLAVRRAPAVAGVLWLFMFAPSIGIVTLWHARAWRRVGTRCSTAATPWR